MYTFTYLRPIIAVCMLVPWAQTQRCGPEERCVCSNIAPLNHVEINCSKTGIQLSDMCAYILESNSTQIVQVDLSQNNITDLKQRDLIGCKNVETLVLSGNQLSAIEADVFSFMKELAVLDLSRNNFTDIYKSKIEPFLVALPRLKQLVINGNFKFSPNTTFSYPDLSKLTSLQSVTLDGLPTTEFGNSYASLTKLETIYLNGSNGICDIGQLQNSTFQYVPHVKNLDLSSCSLTNIDAGTFAVLSELRWLDLSLNRKLGFRVLRNVSFGLQFTKIDFLNYSSTHKTFGLGTELLKRDVCYLYNTTLGELSLNNNRLELVETNALILMPHNLHTVHVEDNRFIFGQYLMQMNCLDNLITVHSNLQNNLHNPSNIYNDENFTVQEEVLPIEEDCPFMTEAYIKNISSFVRGCKYYKDGKINFNTFSAPRKLQNVYFANSNLKYAVTKILILPTLNNIKQIDFSENILYSLQGPIGPFPSLTSVNLSMNYCSHINPQFFNLLKVLETLDLRRNFVGIPLTNDNNGDIFKPLTRLKQLTLSTNQIKHMPRGVFQHLVNLEHLDLSNNTIDVFTPSISNLRNLTSFNLQNNALSKLPEDVIDHFNALLSRGLNYSINLMDNPIRCSCSNRYFLRWMLQNREHFEQFEKYTFMNEKGQPLNLSEFISTVNKFDKTCRSYTTVIVVCTLSLSVFLSVVLGGFVYKNRWKLRYFLYMNKKRFYGYIQLPNEALIENFKYDAFISYADDHIQFILQEIIPNLEEKGMNLCIHQRDFLPGNAIADNIIGAIESSKKTVVLLSKSFLKRKWCLYEFNMARMESIYSRNNGSGCLIVVMLENVPTKDMSVEMVRWLKQESYIEFTRDREGYQLFWNKLSDAITSDQNYQTIN